MTCADLCTADKCAELEAKIGNLENRIENLEQDLILLLASFNAHITEAIPDAHNYVPTVKVETRFFHNQLITEVSVDEVMDFFQTDLSLLELPVDLTIYQNNPSEYIFDLTVGLQKDSDTLTLNNEEELEESPPDQFDIDLEIDSNNRITSSLIINGWVISSKSVIITTEKPTERHIPSNLAASLSFRNDVLTLSIADGESQDTAQTIIPIAASTQTIFITEEVYMNADELEQKIDDCCAILLNRIGVLETYLVAEIEETESNLNNEINDVKEYVTIDISDTAKTQYECIFPFDENGEAIPTYAESITTETTYTGKGLTGIHEQLKLIGNNLNLIHSDVCKAVDPIQTITLKDMYNFCDHSGIKREDYSDDAEGEARYNKDLNAYFFELQRQSKYGHLINNPDDNIITSDNSVLIKLIEAPTNWTNYIISDFALIQSKINRNEICNINIPENEFPDVVNIVASDKVLARATGDLLTLHLVTFDNYPKRSRNSTYWEFQLPEAKDNYTWDDFVNLVWSRGNLFAELEFEEIRDPIVGWFANKSAADSWFNSVLPLTNAVEKTRKYHESSNSNFTVQNNIVRPYRAFISHVNAENRRVIKRKYVPVIENE